MHVFVPGNNPAFAPIPATLPYAFSGGAIHTVGGPRLGIPIDPQNIANLQTVTDRRDALSSGGTQVMPNVRGTSIYVVLPNGLGPWFGPVTTGASLYNVSPVPAVPGAAAIPNYGFQPRPPAGPSVATMPWPRVAAVWPLRGKANG
jgi:hypothetical protein